ncbi:MAG: urea transport system permease protein [Verrucomicrobiales bacterium]|jgi:urea transport system permease protein
MIRLLACLLLIGAAVQSALADEAEARRLLVQLVLAEDDEREAILETLADQGEPIIGEMAAGWRIGQVFRDTVPGSTEEIALLKSVEQYTNLLTGETVVPSGDLKIDRPSRTVKKILRRLVDLIDLNSPEKSKRIAAAEKLGMSQNPEYLPELQTRVGKQDNQKVRAAFEEAIHISQLANGTPEEKLAAVKALGEVKSFPAKDFIEAVIADEAKPSDELKTAARIAIEAIESRQKFVDFIGTLFRGLSLGSVLLLVSYGLAITFGQMGVINMAHGEFIAIGGYTTYFVQNKFAAMYGVGTPAYGYYFLLAIPLAFIVAAIVGAALEKGMIRFLYSRPLESLLATWGISMILQQLFRLWFGAANVAVAAPKWLEGSLQIGGVSMSYSRVALIVFVVLVVIVTFLLLSKTNWGLHVRATMQDRKMASCLGVPSGRVNMITFAYGSGLAGLAGAFLSQIGNVGPSMGQTYVVDSFMVVVVGGVGNLLGTALSALGIGMIDQGLQPLLGPVMGKISVLLMIILFLQFKPGGIFPARSRSLDD